MDISYALYLQMVIINIITIGTKKAWNYLVPKRLDLAMKRTEDKFV